MTTELESQDKMQDIDKVADECQQLELEIARYNKLQASARQEADTLKARANDLKDELATATWALQETQVEEEQLRAQVVSSPSRRKTELQDAQDYLDARKAECTELEKSILSIKTQLTNVQKQVRNVQTTTTALSSLQAQVEDCESLTKSRQDVLQETQETQTETSQVNNQCDQVERQVQRAQESLQHQAKSHAQELEASQQQVGTLKNLLLGVEKDRRQAMSQAHQGEVEVKELQDLVDKEDAQFQHDMQDLMRDYREMEQAFWLRNEQRLALLGVVSGEA